MLIGFEKNSLNHFLGTLEYPVGKEQLIESAKEREVPLTVISLLMTLPDDHEFSSAEEIGRELAVAPRR